MAVLWEGAVSRKRGTPLLAARWTTDRSSKVNSPPRNSLRALCGAHVVTVGWRDAVAREVDQSHVCTSLVRHDGSLREFSD